MCKGPAGGGGDLEVEGPAPHERAGNSLLRLGRGERTAVQHLSVLRGANSLELDGDVLGVWT